MSIMPSQFDLIGKLLEAASARQRVISQNVSNVNTPGYHRREVRFEEELAKLLDGVKPISAEELEISVQETLGLAERADGNNVDIDMEMGEMTRNVLLYQTYSQILGTQLGMMRSAINGQP
jgi:flagellar basal-body rod protein FlgB